MTLIVVAEEKEIANGILLVVGLSCREELEPSSAGDPGGRSGVPVRELPLGVVAGSGLENAIASLSSGSLP